MQYLDTKPNKNKLKNKITKNNIYFLKQNLKAIIFDMDGTITNTTNLELKCFTKLFGKNKLFWKKYFGPPLKEMLIKVYPNLNSSQINLYSYKWHKIYKNELKVKQYVTEDTKNTLKLLKEKYILGIITNATKKTTLLTLRENYCLFDFVLCAEDYEKHKPNPESLNVIKNKYNLKSKNIVYVGDNIYDIIFGKNAKVKTIGKEDILYNKIGLKKYNPDLIIKKISDLKCLM